MPLRAGAAEADPAQTLTEESPEASADGEAAQTDSGDAAADGDAAEEERLEPDAYFEPVQTNEVTGWPQGPAVWAESAVVMDLDSQTILYSKTWTRLNTPPASPK